jgi:hypothetical protein
MTIAALLAKQEFSITDREQIGDILIMSKILLVIEENPQNDLLVIKHKQASSAKKITAQNERYLSHIFDAEAAFEK